jgi:hypothetical protein
MKILNFDTTPNYDNLIIIGGGPSSLIYRKQIETLLNNKETTSISSNRKAPITKEVDYMLFLDKIFFKQYLKTHKPGESHHIIVGPKIKVPEKIDKTHVYLLNYNHKVKSTKTININQNGYINHKTGGSGFACLLSSVFFQPKNIHIIGFDGPTETTMHHFNGADKEIGIEKTNRSRKFLKLILVYLINKDIKIYSYQQDQFWNLNRDALGIQTH